MYLTYFIIGIIGLLGLVLYHLFTSRNKPQKQLTKTEQDEFYFSCVCNSLILFAAAPEYLKTLSAPGFNILFELETEFDYAFEDALINQCITSGKIDITLKPELLTFKQRIKSLPPELWNFPALEQNELWQQIRQDADILLTKLHVESRTLNNKFTRIIVANN